jgi:hypothetical protein
MRGPNRLWSLSLILLGASDRRAAIFFAGQFASQTSRGRGADDEWPVKVFNSSVENRVEKSRREIKN